MSGPKVFIGRERESFWEVPVSLISIFPTKLGNYGQRKKIKKRKKSSKIEKRAGSVSPARIS